MKTLRIFIPLFAILFFNCSTSKINNSNYEQLENTAKDKFNKDYNISYNEDKTYAICVKQVKITPSLPSPPLNFFIYDIKNEKILYQSNLANGRVAWKNNEQVEIETIPGIVTGFEPPDTFKDIYDVHLQKILNKR